MTSKRTALIVDDQEGVLQTLDYLFQMHGCRTLLAKSGPAALEMIRTESPDLALVDLHMPGMDGIAVCQALMAIFQEQGRTLPVWLMTGAHTTTAANRAAEVGARALLRKPFDFVALVADMGLTIKAEPSAPIPDSPKGESRQTRHCDG